MTGADGLKDFRSDFVEATWNEWFGRLPKRLGMDVNVPAQEHLEYYLPAVRGAAMSVGRQAGSLTA